MHFFKLYQVLGLVWSQQFHWQTLYQQTQTNPKTWMAVITGLTLYQGI